MILLAMGLALQVAPSEKVRLLCTLLPDAPPIRFLFRVDPATKTFTATRNDADPFNGTAELTDDVLTLHRNDATYISTIQISRTTGNMTMENRSPKYSYVGHVTGTCHKYAGNAF